MTTAVPRGLRELLRAIDGGPFQGYRRILGDHDLGDFRLSVLSVPADALAGPARLRLSIDRSRAGLSAGWTRRPEARVILEDAIIRSAVRAIEEMPGPPLAAAPGSGRLAVAAPGPDILERSTARVGEDALELTLSLDLPAIARRARGEQAAAVLLERLPVIGMAALLFPLRRQNDLKPRVEALTRRSEATAALASRGLAALIPSAALPGHAIPPPLRVAIETTEGTVTGAGVPAGITLIAGASVAGAGAWLRELEAGSRVAPGGTAIFSGPVGTVHAVSRPFGPIDLSAFVRPCPEVPRPADAQSDDPPPPLGALAALVGAIEAGATVLLIDEDAIPAGVLGRDGRMQRILGEALPALIPLIDRLPELRDVWGLSFLIAVRAIGDLCEVADTVLILRDERLEDVTDSARRILRATSTFRAVPPPTASRPPAPREMRVRPADGGTKAGLWGGRGVRVGDDLVDLSDTTLMRDAGQLRAIAVLLKHATVAAPSWRPVAEVLDALEGIAGGDALASLEEPGLWDLARPSRLAISEALARWKRVEFRVAPGTLRQPVR